MESHSRFCNHLLVREDHDVHKYSNVSKTFRNYCFFRLPWNHLTGSDGFVSLHETYQTFCNDCWFDSPLEINCFAASIFREPFTLILYKIVHFVLFAINSTDCNYFNLSFCINNVQDNHIDIFIGKSMNSVRKWRSPLNHR